MSSSKRAIFQQILIIDDNTQSSFTDQFFVCANLQKYVIHCKINERQSENGLSLLQKDKKFLEGRGVLPSLTTF